MNTFICTSKTQHRPYTDKALFYQGDALFLSMYFNFNMNRVECWKITNNTDQVQFFSLEIVSNLTCFKNLRLHKLMWSENYGGEAKMSETTERLSLTNVIK